MTRAEAWEEFLGRATLVLSALGGKFVATRGGQRGTILGMASQPEAAIAQALGVELEAEPQPQDGKYGPGTLLRMMNNMAASDLHSACNSAEFADWWFDLRVYLQRQACTSLPEPQALALAEWCAERASALSCVYVDPYGEEYNDDDEIEERDNLLAIAARLRAMEAPHD